jgi:RNA 3'-terminal phosphate cyclase (ATP)
MEFLHIDGSYGEGGGQILRSAVSLSCITKKPIKIDNIRKNRKVPGLRFQHLTAMKLLAKICNAKVDGLEVGSTSVSFRPGEVESHTINENIGTAGSISLIFQVLIPVVAISQHRLKLSIIGGTDVPWSPTSDYTKHVLSEAYSRMGINFSMNVKKRGYYPNGGGIIDLEVFPSKQVLPINLQKRTTKEANLLTTFSLLSSEQISNEIIQIKSKIAQRGFDVTSAIKNEDALNQGSALLIFSIDETSIIGVDSLLDTKNLKFSDNVVDRFANSNLGVDDQLADMLVLPASLADGMSVITVNEISKHLETNLYVTSEITGCKYGVGKLSKGYEVRVSPSNTSVK